MSEDVIPFGSIFKDQCGVSPIDLYSDKEHAYSQILTITKHKTFKLDNMVLLSGNHIFKSMNWLILFQNQLLRKNYVKK